MSTQPRNPRYFPRMKVRGARRRHQAPLQHAAGSLDRFGLAAIAAVQHVQMLAESFKDFRQRHVIGAEPAPTLEHGERRTP